MRNRRARFLKVLFCIGWLGGLACAFRSGATARDANPEQLLGLIMASYLGTWGPYFLFARRGAAGRAARFVVCTGSILSVVAVFEVPALVGAVDYRVVFSTPTPPWRRPGNRPDPELIFVKEGPRQGRQRFRGSELHRLRGASAWKVYECDLCLDRDGFRNPVDLRSADTIVIGDSFIEGLHVAAPELITARLSEELGRTVANLGRTGYGPQQELHVLRRFGLGLRPRTCVWAFYEGNDLQDENDYEANRKNLRRIVHEDRALYGRSLTRNSLSYAIRTWLRPESTWPARRYSGRFVARSGAEIEIYFATGVQHGDGGPELPRGDSPEMERFRSILAEAHALCRRHGIELVVLFIPSKFRVYRDLCRFPPDAVCRSWGVDDLPRAMEAAVADVSDDIGYVELTPRFLAEAARGAVLYLPDDTHWSAEGHRLAARAVSEFLKARPTPSRIDPGQDDHSPRDTHIKITEYKK